MSAVASVPSGLASRAADVVTEVAGRLIDPAAIAEAADRPDNRDPIHGRSMWTPQTVSHGLPGIALLHAALDRGADLDRCVRAAAEVMPQAPPGGLFGGPTALLAATGTARHGHYPRLRRNLATWVAADQTARLQACRARAGVGVSWQAYDVINGLSGPARLLLDSADDPAEAGPDVSEALEQTLRHLVGLTEPIVVDGHTVPGWWVPPELQVSPTDRADYPRGDFNLGLAHGIPGPLMVLALALGRGHEVPGQRDAVARIAEWLTGWIRTDPAGAAYWPARVGLDDELAATAAGRLFTRPAWCYGAAGVAVALHRAGGALGVRSWRDSAVRVLRDAVAADDGRWAVHGPTLCHGDAGVLRVLHRVGTAEDDQNLLAARDHLAERILGRADPAAPFLFRHVMRDPHAGDGRRVFRGLDVAGALEGAAGVACALLSVTGDPDDERSWDRVLFLS